MLGRSELPTVAVRFLDAFRVPVADGSVRPLVERPSERGRSWGFAHGWKGPWIACRLERVPYACREVAQRLGATFPVTRSAAMTGAEPGGIAVPDTPSGR